MRYLLAAGLLVLIAGCGSKPLEVKGTLALSGGSQDIHWLMLDSADGQPCEGDSGYSDVTQGADVIVRNAKGERVGLGHLGAGKGSGEACVFSFVVHDVDDSGKLFSVEVGHRGDVSFKRSEARSVGLTLGG